MSRNLMKHLNRNPASLGLAATLLLAGCATPTGFKAVFNGRDFTDWDGPVENYEVKEGAIVCRPGKGGTIYTKQEYADFVVRFEFKLPPGGNNGLAIRYPGHGDTAYEGMCECQVLDDNYVKATGQAIDPRQAHGSAYGMVAAARGYQRPTGEWNREEVTVAGSKIKVVLNGTVILDADLSKVTEFLDGKSHPGKDRTTGHFGFAGHNDPVMFRNISIRPLKQSPARGRVSFIRPVLTPGWMPKSLSPIWKLDFASASCFNQAKQTATLSVKQRHFIGHTSPIASSVMLVSPGKAGESIFESDAVSASFRCVSNSSHLG